MNDHHWCGKAEAHAGHWYTANNGSWRQTMECRGMPQDPLLMTRVHQAEDAERIASRLRAQASSDARAVYEHHATKSTMVPE